jgi:BASS family bile acid:Na+ symporter
MGSAESIQFVGNVLIPAGLMLIMFSLGLALTIEEFRKILASPRAVAVGLVGQLLVLPVIAFGIATFLPAPLATGLVILAACPGGVTSNAIIFAARGDIALSVSLTTISSFLTVLTTPLYIGLALSIFYAGGDAPEISILGTMKKLFMLTVLPVVVGMLGNHFFGGFASVLVRWLRPTSMLVLLGVIVFSIAMSFEDVFDAALLAGPAVLLLNVCAMTVGYMLARQFKLTGEHQLTIGIEVGVQNAAMATFLVLAVLNDLAISIVPSVYGLVMFATAAIFIRWARRHNNQPLEQAIR